MDLEQEIAEDLAAEMLQELNRQELWNILEAGGWTRVRLLRFRSGVQAVDISDWIRENQTAKVYCCGAEFLFKSTADAAMFILRWSS